MTQWNHRLLAAGVTGVIASGSLAACGVDTEDAGKKAPPAPVATTPKKSGQTIIAEVAREKARKAAANRAKLPKATAGTVTVVSGSSVGVTRTVSKAFEGQSRTSVTLRDTSDRVGFAALCDGKADIVESSRLMSQAEIDRCTKNGLDLVTDATGRLRPIQLAAEGIVVATKNEEDLGGDCLKRSTVRQIFRAGSDITNWSQVGFDDVPLTTTGRQDNTDVFNLFGNLVLGASGDATRADVRADYKVKQTDTAVREEITGSQRMERAVRAAKKELDKELKAVRNKRAKARVDAANKASADLRIVIRKENAALAKSKKVLTDAQVKRLVDTNRRRNTEARKAAAKRADDAIVGAIKAEVSRKLRAKLDQVAGPGTVGYFRFTYYELFENLLRPVEIWDPVISQATFEQRGIATNRTHSKPTLQTDATLQGSNASVSSEQIYSETPTTPGTTYIASAGQRVTVPAGGPIDVDKTPNCVFPSRRTISSGVYPLSVRLLAYVTKRALARKEVRDFFAYYLTDGGQTTVADQRLIPLDDAVRTDEYKALIGKNPPNQTINNAGAAVSTEDNVTNTVPGGTPAPGSATVPDDTTDTVPTPSGPTQTQTSIPGVGG